MRRRFCLLATVWLVLPIRADVLVVTWNMKWFPSGLADVRRETQEECARVERAGRTLAAVVSEQTKRPGAELVVFAQEVRDFKTVAEYAAASGIAGLKPTVVSNFRDNGGVPLWQQVAILTTLPVLDAGFATWSVGSGVHIPRGFAYALLDGGESGPIACFCLHLKSNVNWSGSEVENQRNIYKREAAAAQVLAMVKKMREERPERNLRVLVGGDFNTSDDDLAYVSEATLRSFYGAHFRSCFRDLPREQKVTHPGSNGFPDATFDYILYRGFERIVSRRIHPGQPVSDHNLVALRLR